MLSVWFAVVHLVHSLC